MMRRKVAVVATHPVPYHSSWYRGMAAHSDLELSVYFCQKATPREQSQAGFGVDFDWDIPLLEGFRYRFLANVSRRPSVHTFGGLDTPEIKDVISRERYDAVIVNGWNFKSAWQAIRTCWKSRTPVMVRGDSHLKTRRSLWKRMGKWPCYRWFIPRLDACLATGAWSRDYYLHYGARADRVFLVPHAIDDAFFEREARRWQPQRRALRSSWALDPDAAVFVFAGKFIDKKRPLDFVKALAIAARRGGRVEGLMVGDGPLRPTCEALARSSRAPVRFAGFLNQSEIARAYVAADALILPSDGGETWGLVVNEAMACGLACIVSDHVGCSPDIVRTGRTGAIYPLGDVAALAELLVAEAANPGRLEAMGEHARRASREHCVDRAVAGVLEAIEAVTRGRG